MSSITFREILIKSKNRTNNSFNKLFKQAERDNDLKTMLNFMRFTRLFICASNCQVNGISKTSESADRLFEINFHVQNTNSEFKCHNFIRIFIVFFISGLQFRADFVAYI